MTEDTTELQTLTESRGLILLDLALGYALKQPNSPKLVLLPSGGAVRAVLARTPIGDEDSIFTETRTITPTP